jgi:hypothetical protein
VADAREEEAVTKYVSADDVVESSKKHENGLLTDQTIELAARRGPRYE